MATRGCKCTFEIVKPDNTVVPEVKPKLRAHLSQSIAFRGCQRRTRFGSYHAKSRQTRYKLLEQPKTLLGHGLLAPDRVHHVSSDRATRMRPTLDNTHSYRIGGE